jgi:hypothetical protein
MRISHRNSNRNRFVSELTWTGSGAELDNSVGMSKPNTDKRTMRRNLITFLIASVIVSLAVVLVRGVESDGQGASPVISIREFELRSGVKPDEFEKYAREELTRALSQAKTGAHFRILKGDRGDRKGGIF